MSETSEFDFKLKGGTSENNLLQMNNLQQNLSTSTD